ncbi:MAG: rhomboid family intramembrane serine protease [Gemmataceae bacterium]
MNDPIPDALDAVLRRCAASAPEPLYPKLYAAGGISRESLDTSLEKLRLGGLVRLTPWEKDKGQGYELTPEGAELLQNPRDLHRLREGKLPQRQATLPQPASANGARMTTFERGEMVREALLNEPEPIVSRVVLGLNILVFAYGLFLASRANLDLNYYIMGTSLLGGQPRNDLRALTYYKVLDDSGALNAIGFMNGQWWRLITCCFVHIGLLHLFVNMLALYRAGPLIEQMWGHARYLWIYLLSGWGGSCLALIVNPAGCAGASGSLCGIFASQAFWTFLNRKALPPELLSSWYRVLGINLVLIVFVSLIPGISWAGHLGGAIAGAVTALLLHVHRFSKPVWGRLALMGTLVLPAFGITALSVRYYGLAKADKALHQASNAINEALPILNSDVFPFLRRPIPPVNAVVVSRPPYKLLSEPVPPTLPEDPEAAERSTKELQTIIEKYGNASAKVVEETDSLAEFNVVSVFWDKIHKSAFQETIDLAGLIALIDFYLHTERDVRIVFNNQSHAKHWIARHSSRRDPPEAVENTIRALAQERERLGDIVDRFANAGPYSTRRTEEVRKTLEELIREWSAFLSSTEDYLRNQMDVETGLNAHVKSINVLRLHVVNLCVSQKES